MDKEKILYPAMIGVGVLALVWLNRKQPGVAVQQNAPGTSGSGLPSYDPQVQQYNLSPATLAPSGGLFNPAPNILGGNAYGANDFSYHHDSHDIGPTFDISTDSHDVSVRPITFNNQTYNFMTGATPIATPTKASANGAGNCGCGGDTCNSCSECASKCKTNKSRFPDGHGGCMSFSEGTLVDGLTTQYPALWRKYGANLESSNSFAPDVMASRIAVTPASEATNDPNLDYQRAMLKQYASNLWVS